MKCIAVFFSICTYYLSFLDKQMLAKSGGNIEKFFDFCSLSYPLEILF